jgi:hypothetical protein
LSEQRLIPQLATAATATLNSLYQPGLDVELTAFGRNRLVSLMLVKRILRL